ncbi:hypothetical protein OSTOST_13682 [Ostertagia ostertagi]
MVEDTTSPADHSEKKAKKPVETAIESVTGDQSEGTSSPIKKKKKNSKAADNSESMAASQEEPAGQSKKKKEKFAVGPSSSSDSFDKHEVTEEVAGDGIDASSPTKKKKKKRENGDTTLDCTAISEIENEGSPRKKKKRQHTEDLGATAKQPEGEYVVGSLSSIFGGSSEVPVDSGDAVPVVKGEACISA